MRKQATTARFLCLDSSFCHTHFLFLKGCSTCRGPMEKSILEFSILEPFPMWQCFVGFFFPLKCSFFSLCVSFPTKSRWKSAAEMLCTRLTVCSGFTGSSHFTTTSLYRFSCHWTAGSSDCSTMKMHFFNNVIFGINSLYEKKKRLTLSWRWRFWRKCSFTSSSVSFCERKVILLTDFKCACPYGFPVNYIWILLNNRPTTAKEVLTYTVFNLHQRYIQCLFKRNQWKQKMYKFIRTLHLTSTNCTRETCYFAAKHVFFSRSLQDCSVFWLKKWAPGLLECTCWGRWAASSSGQQWSGRSGWSSTRLDAAYVSSPGPHLTVKEQGCEGLEHWSLCSLWHSEWELNRICPGKCTLVFLRGKHLFVKF